LPTVMAEITTEARRIAGRRSTRRRTTPTQ
jgi:hypothetical protein